MPPPRRSGSDSGWKVRHLLIGILFFFAGIKLGGLFEADNSGTAPKNFGALGGGHVKDFGENRDEVTAPAHRRGGDGKPIRVEPPLVTIHNLGGSIEHHHEGSVNDGVHSDAVAEGPVETQEHDAHWLSGEKREGEPGLVSLRGVTCPPYDKSIDALQIPLKHLPRKKKTSVGEKYDRRAHNCASHGIWNRVTREDHHRILQHIAEIGKIERNSFVLDWGSGCGHSLEWLSKEWGTTGVGIDVSNKTIAFARENTTDKNLHCVADGTKLQWIPSATFDHAFSFGSVYHVYNRTLFCHVLRQLVRVVKSPGTVYNGWTENAEYKRDHVKLCLEDLPVRYEIVEEARGFHDVKIFPLKSQQQRPNTYSLVIHKESDIEEELDKYLFDWDYLPITCGVHKCEKRKVHLPTSVALQHRYHHGHGESDEHIVPHGPVETDIPLPPPDHSGSTLEPLPSEAPADEHKDAAGEQSQHSAEGPEQAETHQQETHPQPTMKTAHPGVEQGMWDDLQCPPYDAMIEELQIPLKHLPRKKKTSVAQKYDRRAHNCAAEGIWHRVSFADHHAILKKIAEVLTISPGDNVFDWGCGCGHKLAFLSQEYNTYGFGIDVSNKTIEYAAINATANGRNKFCVADGTRLEWLPSDRFQSAFSFGSIYHVYNETKFCDVLRQMVRIVRPGGVVYNGWTENSEFHREKVYKCINGPKATSKRKKGEHHITILEEKTLFAGIESFPLKAQRKTPNTYSLHIKKAHEEHIIGGAGGGGGQQVGSGGVDVEDTTH